MIDQYCQICKGFNNSGNFVVRLYDDKDSIEINGHENCRDELHSKIRNVKDLGKKSVSKVLNEIGLSVD